MKSVSLLLFLITNLSWASNRLTPLNIEKNRNDLQSRLQAGFFLFKPSNIVSDKNKLGVMDVSFLWPEYSQRLLPAIDKNNSENNLLPSIIPFDSFLDFTDVENNISLKNPFTGLMERVSMPTDSLREEPLENFRVVSFRVDDCGPLSRHHGIQNFLNWKIKGKQKQLVNENKKCVPQLRLVLQPSMYWEDVALHFIYSFVENPLNFETDFLENKHVSDEKILEALMRDLMHLKQLSPVSTKNASLGPHLGLSAGGEKALKFEESVIGFLKHYARKEYLSEIAVLSTNNFDGGSDWIFASMQIQQKNPDLLVLNPIQSIKGSPLTQGFSINEQVSQLERPDKGLLSLEERDIEKMIEVGNPQRTSSSSADCVSCHAETRALVNLSSVDPESILKASFSNDKFPSALMGTNAFPNPLFLPSFDSLGKNFRAFGFFGGKPSVNFRVAYESGQVADSMNKRLFASYGGYTGSLENKQCHKNSWEVVKCTLGLNSKIERVRCLEQLNLCK